MNIKEVNQNASSFTECALSAAVNLIMKVLPLVSSTIFT